MFECEKPNEKQNSSTEIISVSKPSTGVDDSSLSLSSSEIVSVPQHLRQDVQCSDKAILSEGESTNIAFQSNEPKSSLKRSWQTEDQPNPGMKRVKTYADHSKLDSSIKDIQVSQLDTNTISNDSSTTPLLTSESSTVRTEKAANQTSKLSSFSSASSSFSSSEAISRTQMITPSVPSEEPIPEKSTRMSHLRSKYYAELDYMLREFRKLERQLLGAKGNGAGVEESQGSRERREKLHSFILHLEDTIRQIEAGCSRELECKSQPSENQQEKANVATESCLNEKKDDAETVQKLEDHILANLLPVKVRLKKQLAAQQGATRNPIGMPIAPRGMPPVVEKGMGTFAAAAEEKRKLAEAVRAAAREQALLTSSPPAPSQFGQPITITGSSLTQKLHGPTLGSQARPHGHGVGSEKPSITDSSVPSQSTDEPCDPPRRKVLYGGMARGSTQLLSGVSAAAGAHNIIVESPALKKALERTEVKAENSTERSQTNAQPVIETNTKIDIVENVQSSEPNNEPTLSEEERRRMQKQRRKRKKQRILARREKERQRQLFLQQQVVQASALAQKSPSKKSGKTLSKAGTGKKSGPRTVEYICALCSEAYGSTCDCNPWWALASQECPKCRKCQIPRIDITSPVNAIEYHPALLAHAEESPNESNKSNSAQPSNINTSQPLKCTSGMSKITTTFMPNDSDEETDLSELSDADNLSDDSYDSDNSEDDMPLTEGELAEMESFGKEYEGPKLTPDQASRLLIMMGHAQTCPGRHNSTRHRDCCNSVKFLMLHVRDCPGTTLTMDVCPFPWCRKVKHLMYHLVACSQPDNCAICSPIALSSNMKGIIGLSTHRRKIRKTESQSAVPVLAAVKPHPVTNKSSQEVKPLIPNENRPIVKKPPCPVTTIKPSTIKSSIVPPPKTNSSNRGTTNSINPSPKAPSAAKPTNGVVVKSLVKPAGRSVVILKTRAQRPGPPGSKPTVAALCGSKSSLTKTQENGDTSSAKGLLNGLSNESSDPNSQSVDKLKQDVCEGLNTDIAIDELEVAIVEDLIMTGDINGTSDRCSTENMESNQISQSNKDILQDDQGGKMVMETEESTSSEVLKPVATIYQTPNNEQHHNDLSLVNSTTTAIVSSDVSTATIKSEDQITLSMASMNAEDFFSHELGDLDNGKLMEAIIQEPLETSPATAEVLDIPPSTLFNSFALKREGGESSSFLLLDSSFNILANPGNASTFSLSAIAELHDDDLKMQQLPSSYEYAEQVTTAPKTSSSPILFPEVIIKVEKETDGEFLN